jgi:LPXTG-motif cell wall-anchored protein
LLGVALIGLLSAFVLAPSMAGAQTIPGEGTVPPPPPGDCTYSSPTTVNAIGDTITITGSAPAGVTVQLFVNGAQTPSQEVVLPDTPAFPTFSFDLQISGDPTSFTLSYLYGNKNAYTATCSGIEGALVTRITVASQNAGRLAFTGSSETPAYVFVGLAALVLGAVFVVAARRRARTDG